MNQKILYKNALRSQNLIKRAYVDLLAEKQTRITITDIVKKADINRGTFYAHFNSTEEVLEQIENEILMKLISIMKEYKDYNVISNTKEILIKLSAYIESDFDFFSKLLTSRSSDGFYKKVKIVFINTFNENNEIPDRIKSTNHFKILVSFFAGGIISLYQDWFSHKLVGTLDEISDEISKYASAMHIVTINNIERIRKEHSI